MNKPTKVLLAAVSAAVLLLAGCGASPTISNVSIPGGARDAQSGTMGKNTNLRYLTNLSVDEACAAQVKLLTDAKWQEKEAMRKEATYSTADYTDGKAVMVLMCSETEISATEKGTKVTLTLMANS